MAGEVSVTLTYSGSNGSPSDPKDLLTCCCHNLSVLAKMENFPGICPLISNILRADPGKENAVITGRKAWGSILAEHRPLHVVLTHRESFNIGTAENVVKYGIMCIALYLLPMLLSIEKVSVIGGGQREALNAPGCDAIHITEVETPVEFDTFLPMVDTSVFQSWFC